jgi:hypothetical protein
MLEIETVGCGKIYVRMSSIDVIYPGPTLLLRSGERIQVKAGTSVDKLLEAIAEGGIRSWVVKSK